MRECPLAQRRELGRQRNIVLKRAEPRLLSGGLSFKSFEESRRGVWPSQHDEPAQICMRG